MSRGDVFWNLEQAQNLLKNVEDDLNNAPEKADIVELLDAIESIDNYYRDNFCREIDDNYDEPHGTTYEDGISLEFYIEASWWDDVSKALRKLRDRTVKED